MADNANEHVVIAIFTDQSAAERAIDSLKSWDHVNLDVKLGAIGTVIKDGDKVRTQVGRKTGKGAGVGAILGVIAAVLSGGVTLLGGVFSGAALGGVIGAFMKQSVQLNEDEIQALGRELEEGKVAVVVLCDADEIEPVTAHLTRSGGLVRTYDVPTKAVAETSDALAAESALAGTSSQTGAETV
jgi:uncharacterized membrane protein